VTFRKPLILFPVALLIVACATPGATTRPSNGATLAATSAPASAATAAPATQEATAAPTPTAPIDLSTPSPAADVCARDALALKNPGRLTLSTDIPAFPPWWGGDAATQYDNEPEGGSPWSDTDFSAEPYSMEGFEGAMAYAVAEAMGFSADEVDWLANPDFALAFAPGEKPFDFHMAQISATADRAQAVTFSDPYFDSNQAVLALTTNDITGVTSIEDLKSFRLAAAANTTSFTFLENVIAPTTEVLNFPDNAGTLQALQGDVVDGIIVDLSTAFYMRDAQLEDFETDDPEGTIVGQFGPPAEPDHVAFVLELDNPLVACVNQALAEVKESGLHQEILDEWINTGQDVPFLE
jgi:polar amino acid transport system substrate-binding protein